MRQADFSLVARDYFFQTKSKNKMQGQKIFSFELYQYVRINHKLRSVHTKRTIFLFLLLHQALIKASKISTIKLFTTLLCLPHDRRYNYLANWWHRFERT